MRADARSAEIARHYDRWPFPGEDFSTPEGLLLLRTLHACLQDAGAAAQATGEVIDVGCGTGHTALALARRLPHVRFRAVDLAAEALRLARQAADETGVTNISFAQADLMQPLTAEGRYRVVLCFGVLHHVPCPRTAMAHLAGLVADRGYLLLWVYGRHGRQRHNLNQAFLRILTQGASGEESLAAAAEFLAQLGDRFATDTGFFSPAGSGAEGIRYLRERPQWLADQMLPAHEEPFCLEDLLKLFDGCGLEFCRWLGVPVDLASYTSSPLLLDHFRRLSERDRLRTIDCLLKPAHYLVLGHRTAGAGQRP